VNCGPADNPGQFGATLNEVAGLHGSACANVVSFHDACSAIGWREAKTIFFFRWSVPLARGFAVGGQMWDDVGDRPCHAGLAGGGLRAKAQSLLFETFPREEQEQRRGCSDRS